MRTIGVREFRDQASSLLASEETLVIERHGEAIGFYVPIAAKDRREGVAALGRLGAAVGEVLSRTALVEDDLVREITPRRRAR
jgi:antitoxin (DNA-binding transcriptional repressor) of toxin-antitoxin stability system